MQEESVTNEKNIPPNNGKQHMTQNTNHPPHPEESQEQGVESKLSEENALLKEEKNRNYDLYLRTLAELENNKRRAIKERGEILKFGQEEILRDLLTVTDGFDQALLKATNTEDLAVIKGVELVHKQLVDILQKHGLSPIDAIGNKFDPELHQALKREEDPEVKEEIVKEVYVKGYLLNGRLLRASMVSVAIPVEKKTE